MPYGYNANTNMINQLYRQRDNIENMIAQYGQPQQPPVQNIINTTNSATEIDVRFLNANEDISNIIISKRTLFIDEPHNKISIKELDGSLSKTYDIIVPKDEKDLKIEELENKLRELEEKINVQHAEPIVSSDDVKSTGAGTVKFLKPTTKTND